MLNKYAALVAVTFLTCAAASANTGVPSPVATCYDAKASARLGDSMIQKLDLAVVSRNSKPYALAGKGI